jgi:hypothetical protein
MAVAATAGACPADQVLGSEGNAVSSSGQTVTDGAGNTSAPSNVVTVKLDKTPPTLAGAATTSPNANGWYKGDVTIAWTCADTLSGISGACPGDSPITGEGAGLSRSASVSDRASNTTQASSTVNIDRTPPVTTAQAPSGWTNDNVGVSFITSDNLAGVQTTFYRLGGGSQQTYSPGATLNFTTDGVYTLQFWSVDKAGNGETYHTVQVRVDKAAPTITHSNSLAANANGWKRDPVTVTFTCTDDLSQMASCTGPTTVPTEGLGQLVTGTAVDNAGNTAADPVVLNIDKTAPTISGAAFPLPTAAGWNNTTVSVSFTCTDPQNANGTPGSGIASCPAPVTLSSDGSGQSVPGTATDSAGNTADTTVSGIKIDRAAPTLAPSVSPNPVFLGGIATTSPNATDALSGVASQSCVGVDTSRVGSYTVTCTATDRAGNTATATAAYTVAYGQKLLYNTTNPYKGESDISIVLQLQDASGKNVSSATIPVTALAVVNSSGTVVKTVNAAFAFAKDKSQYRCSLHTSGLSSGSYTLRFSSGSDPTTHLAPFNIE